MLAWHAPVTPDNPYQTLMFRALENAGISVETSSFTQLVKCGPAIPSHPDLIHLHWVHGFYQAFGRLSRVRAWLRGLRFMIGLSRARRRVPVIWTMHNLRSHQHLHPLLDQFLTRFLERRADRIIVHCPQARAMLLQAGVEERRIRIIAHGSYDDFYPDLSRAEARSLLGLAPENRVLLSFGTMRANKGVAALLKVFLGLDSPELRLVVAGGDAPDILQRTLSEAAAKDSRLKLFLRRIPDDEVSIFFRAADVLVLPYEEGLTSGVMALGMDFGLPLVAPRSGCLPEQAAEGGAIWYRPQDPGGLEAAVTEAASRDLAGMGEKNRALAAKRKWDVLVKDLIDVYEEARAEKRSGMSS